MIKGLAITPPAIGRISIGKVVEKQGKRLPEKDDEFTITTQIQTREGWVHHPLDESLRKTPGAKLRAIPIRLLFDEVDLNLRANYTLFDRSSGRQVCVGSGETCKRVTASGIESLPCPTPYACEFGQGICKPYGRLNVRIGDEDELGTFVFRTTGFNSIRTLMARLTYFFALSGGMLSCLPLELRLRGKSTTKSHRTPIYYVDVTVRTGTTLTEALTEAKVERERRRNAGFDQAGLDLAARVGFANGAFEEVEEDGSAVVEEFCPDIGAETADATNDEPSSSEIGKNPLHGRLGTRLSEVRNTGRDTAGRG
ncbi:recombination directionality factor [Zoogloea dura]|uniref:recombination directionality factor n=1 Tax=Zoogloea dura TaxID=2728840 RepID=UPI00197EA17E|nr:hydrolase or metal-binding protein [Zoogloea dura]